MSTTEGSEMSTSQDTYDAHAADAYRLGEEAGFDAAAWYFDGSETRADLARIVEMFADGDPEIYDTLPTDTLSGEWAGSYSLADLADDLGIEQDDDAFDDLARFYQDGFAVAVADRVEAEARRKLDDLGTHDGRER